MARSLSAWQCTGSAWPDRTWCLLQILQALLQNSGGAPVAPQVPAGWVSDNDAQERVRLLQLQNLLAALQVGTLPLLGHR
jgi:hypothetical protein